MTAVNIKLSNAALINAKAVAADQITLRDQIEALLEANGVLAERYSYFDDARESSNKFTLLFDDGSSRTYNGVISPTLNLSNYKTGTALAHTVVLKVPAGITETVKGQLSYSYKENPFDGLLIEYTGGTITDYKLDLYGKLADEDYGRVSAGFSGQLAYSATGQISGTISKFLTTASKLHKQELIEGDFSVNGDLNGVQVSGITRYYQSLYHDKSVVEVRGALSVDTGDVFSVSALNRGEYWDGDDIFTVELANNVTESLLINTGAGNDHLTLKGGRGHLRVDAGSGNDTIRLLDKDPVIRGGDGIDTVETAFSYSIAEIGDIENLTLYGKKKADATGNALNNVLTGNDVANILDGREGADRMIGGLGNDIYIVDNLSDQTIELAKQGVDTVRAWLSWTLAENLENLELMGQGHLNGTGNGAANKITGNSGNNTLDGAGGVDILAGGGGNDTYIVDLVIKGSGSKRSLVLEDKIIETANNGIDTLQLRGQFNLDTATTVKLANHLENLDASGTGSTLLNLTGNNADNLLIGNDADNILVGGNGADQLFGGGGRDTFRFLSLKELGLGDRQDVILDFTRGEDVLDFKAKAFKGYSFIGQQDFTALKQLRYETDGDDLILFGNSAGDTRADFSLKLVGINALGVEDLLLG